MSDPYARVRDLMTKPASDAVYAALPTMKLSPYTAKCLACEVCNKPLSVLHTTWFMGISDFYNQDIGHCDSWPCRLAALKSINAVLEQDEWLFFYDKPTAVNLKVVLPKESKNSNQNDSNENATIVQGQLVFARRSSDKVNISVGLRYTSNDGTKYNGVIRLQALIELNVDQTDRLRELSVSQPPFYNPVVVEKALTKWKTQIADLALKTKSKQFN